MVVAPLFVPSTDSVFCVCGTLNILSFLELCLVSTSIWFSVGTVWAPRHGDARLSVVHIACTDGSPMAQLFLCRRRLTGCLLDCSRANQRVGSAVQ
jgi:hypothetical protein